MSTATITLIVTVVVCVGAFLLLREVVCWYLKINKRMEQMDRIDQQLLRTNIILETLAKQKYIGLLESNPDINVDKKT